ncbi:hypothetical protein ACJ41O_003322 [Fusarium nematophilum]
MADSASVSGSPKTESDEEFREPRYPDLYLELARFNLEILYDYELGYLHPIHLHDTLNGRYRVIHKLGHGGSATIWLYLTPSNVLLQAHGLDGLSEDEVLQVLGTPVRNSVMMDSNTGHDELSVPQYLVYPVKWQNVPSKYIGEQPSLIDFGESFNTARPPEDLGTPGPYRSPELILETAIGLGADLWALGCTLFEIRTGRGLFKTFDDDDNEYIDAMVQVLGKLPEPWWSTTWEIRRKCYKDEADENGLAVSAAEPETPGVWYLEVSLSEEGHREIPQQEIDIFADFLGRLLQYEPEKRMSAAAALEHEWFKL